MNPLPLFVLQFVWFFVVWATIGHVFVDPRLRGADPDRALAVWLCPQLFRVLGTGLLVPNLAPEMPRAFAVSTAVGDAITAGLALVALVALERRSPYARRVVWICTVVGLCDVIVALVTAARIEAARYLAAQWFVPAVGVPLMIVSHVMVLRILLGRRP
jgi:hypothetical protein